MVMGMGGLGKGKVLPFPITSNKRKELQESNGSSDSPSIRRRMAHGPINGPQASSRTRRNSLK